MKRKRAPRRWFRVLLVALIGLSLLVLVLLLQPGPVTVPTECVPGLTAEVVQRRNAAVQCVEAAR